MPQISVIVPIYKVEPYLKRCVDSILGQTFTDFELILVDDGSPDNCGAICDEYAEKDERVKVIHQANGGLSAARNAGIDYAFSNSNSEWLTFIDSDDWVHNHYLASLLNAANKNKSDISICGFIGTKGEEPILSSNPFYFKKMSTETFYLDHYSNAIIACGKLYKKSCFENIRYPIGRIYEDGFTTYKILFKYNKILFIPSPLYFYFTNTDGIMHRKFSLKNYEGILAREERIEFFNKNGYHEIAIKEEHANIFEIALFSIASRKHKIYGAVPKKYKVGWLKAMRIVRKNCSRDQYEWIMHEYHPLLVKIFAKLYRILNIFKKKASK